MNNMLLLISIVPQVWSGNGWTMEPCKFPCTLCSILLGSLGCFGSSVTAALFQTRTSLSRVARAEQPCPLRCVWIRVQRHMRPAAVKCCVCVCIKSAMVIIQGVQHDDDAIKIKWFNWLLMKTAHGFEHWRFSFWTSLHIFGSFSNPLEYKM